MPAGEAETNRTGGCAPDFYWLSKKVMLYHNISFYSTQHGREFFGGRRQRECLSRFSVLRFRREFLSRMRIPKGNRTRRSGLARFGMDADRGRPQPMITCAILLRNPQLEKVHGKPGQAIPLPPPSKKLPPVRPPINITFQAEL